MERSHEAAFARRRITVAVVAVVLAFLYGVPAYFASFHPLGGTYGWTVQPNGVIQSVAPGLPAQRAHLHAGERVDFSQLSHADAYRIGSGFGTRAGHRMQIAVQTREGFRNVVLVAESRPRTAVSALTSVLLSLQGLLFLLVGAFVALRRPNAAGLWFFAFATTAPPSGELTVFYSFLPDTAAAIVFGFVEFWLASALIAVPFMMFALYFPDGRISRAKQRFVPVVTVVAAVSIAQAVWETLRSLSGGFNVSPLSIALDNSALAVALLLFGVEYAWSNAAMRTRLFWVFVALGLEAIVLAAAPLYPLMPNAYPWILALNTFVPIMLAYAILRHHVFDITFTVNRAMAYTLLTIALGLGIGLIDWFVEGFIGSRKIALALEALVAVGFGMALDQLRRRLERFIDRAIFRERHAAERQVQRVIASLSFADSYEAVGAATVDDVTKAMGLASAALFLRQDDRRYRRVHSYNWESSHCSMLSSSDSILRVMQAELAPLRVADLPWHCDGPDRLAGPAVAIPLVARNELLGVLLYGMHLNGLSIDPGEIDLLRHLGRAAANALDNVEARVTRLALEEARRRLAALQHI